LRLPSNHQVVKAVDLFIISNTLVAFHF